MEDELNGQDRLLLTVREAASQLGLGRSHVYKLIMAGEIRSILIGRSRRVPAQGLDQYIANLLEEQSDS